MRARFRGGRGNKRSRNGTGNNDRRDAKDILSRGSARVSVVVVIIHFLPCDKPQRRGFSRGAGAGAGAPETIDFTSSSQLNGPRGQALSLDFHACRYIGPLVAYATRVRGHSRDGFHKPVSR